MGSSNSTLYRILMVAGVLVPALGYASFFVIQPDVVNRLAEEDSLIEWGGALYMLAAAVLLAWAYFKTQTGNDLFLFKTRRNIFFLLLALVLFVGFGEEISWGQRIFGFETPGIIKEHNYQEEMNIHNLAWFHGKTLEGEDKFHLDVGNLFWISYCVLLPLLNLAPWVGGLTRRMNLPVIPLGLGALFALHFLLTKFVKIFLAAELDHARVELKEAHIAFLFLLVGIFWLCNFDGAGDPESVQSS